jgi:hypothetical protein
VEIVRLGGAERQDGDLPLLGADEGVRLFGEDGFIHEWN